MTEKVYTAIKRKGRKEVWWYRPEACSPSPLDILVAAAEEFTGVPLDKLEIAVYEYFPHFILLRSKPH